MAIFMLVLHVAPAWALLWLFPVALIPTLVVLAAALGIFLASVNVYLRDTQHLVEVLVGAAWFWACPIVYSFQAEVAAKLTAHHLFGLIVNWLFFLNPLTPIVMTFQRVLYNRIGTVHLTSPGTSHWSSSCPRWPAHPPTCGRTPSSSASPLVLFYVAMVVFGRLAGNFAEEL